MLDLLGLGVPRQKWPQKRPPLPPQQQQQQKPPGPAASDPHSVEIRRKSTDWAKTPLFFFAHTSFFFEGQGTQESTIKHGPLRTSSSFASCRLLQARCCYSWVGKTYPGPLKLGCLSWRILRTEKPPEHTPNYLGKLSLSKQQKPLWFRVHCPSAKQRALRHKLSCLRSCRKPACHGILKVLQSTASF